MTVNIAYSNSTYLFVNALEKTKDIGNNYYRFLSNI